MKIPVMFYVAFTTLMLVILTVISSMNMAFIWVFYTMCLGQFLLVIMVYKVLRYHYTTDKTFEHFYEDKPVNYRK